MQLKRGLPGENGISPRAILDFLNAAEARRLGLHSFLLMRHGCVVSEGWWKPYRREDTHMLYSLSKSFTSTAIGLCVKEGRIRIEDRLIDLFPEKLSNLPCENMQKLKLRHLLSMSTGHSVEPDVFSKPAAVQAFLESFLPNEPGTLFVYNTAATYVLSAVVTKVTGMSTMEYLRERLFEPYGFSEDIDWEKTPEGICTGGFGLNVTTEDIARLGDLYLHHGRIGDKQVLPADWVELATSRVVSNGDPAQKSDWSQGYGFQFWRCQPEGVYRGDGMYGQYMIVMPRQDAVLAITAGNNVMQGVLDTIWETLLPAMRDEKVPEDGQEALSQKIASLEIPCPKGAGASARFAGAGRVTYDISDNARGLQQMALTFDAAGALCSLSLTAGGRETSTPVGNPTYAMGTLGLDMLDLGRAEPEKPRYEPVCAACAWENETACRLRLVWNRTPLYADVTLRFVDSALKIDIQRNVDDEEHVLRLIGCKK